MSFSFFGWYLLEIEKKSIGPRVGGQCQSAGYFRGGGIT
jgi:hypothetical protein